MLWTVFCSLRMKDCNPYNILMQYLIFKWWFRPRTNIIHMTTSACYVSWRFNILCIMFKIISIFFYNNTIRWFICEGWHVEKYLHNCIISLRGEVWVHKTIVKKFWLNCLNQERIVKVMHLCAKGIDFDFLRFFNWILECFWQFEFLLCIFILHWLWDKIWKFYYIYILK
jgi:hypothetical protein